VGAIVQRLQADVMLDRIIALCRPGFEKECAAELQYHANQCGLSTYIKTSDDSGYVQLVFSYGDASALFDQVRFSELIFSRQWFATGELISDLPEQNRLSPLLDNIHSLGMHFDTVQLNWPDTNEGKSISKFCKQFLPHLETALKKQKFITANATQSLQCLFLDSRNVFIGIAKHGNCSPYPMGIVRLKMHAEAPSRSALKLEEALGWFLDEEDARQFIKPGMKAVDLGAAPGGWSWQLTKRGMLVTAIDNGPMQQQLLDDGMVEHLRVDAFTWMPDNAVDWLVCDMAERPMHVSRLICRWFTRNRCHYSIFNLKLPMNKRYHAVIECLTSIHETLAEANIQHALFARHLYHDREEITVFCRKLHPGEILT